MALAQGWVPDGFSSVWLKFAVKAGGEFPRLAYLSNRIPVMARQTSFPLCGLKSQ